MNVLNRIERAENMQRTEEIITFFDRLAKDWNNHPEEYDKREQILSLSGFSAGSVIADIGCGCGVMLPHLLKAEPKEIIAIDISGEMLNEAQKAFPDPRITYRHEDFLQIELPEIDAAIIYNAYPHFLDKQALVEKAAQVIPKGRFLVIAHGCGKEVINGSHSGERVSTISAALEPAEKEAEKFKSFFSVETMIDKDEIYFIKLIRI